MAGHDHSIRHHRSGHASCLGACPGLLGTPDIAHCWFRSKETNEVTPAGYGVLHGET